MFHPKKIVTVLGITALMLGPVSLPSFDLGSGPAFADNGKGGGGGNGGGGGGGNGGGGKGGEKSGGKSKERAGGNGGGKAAEKSAAREAPAKAKPKAAAAPVAEGEVVFAARDLGNMNGAMNANVNAVLAHIRNGNFNGPVGAVAGLVAADARAGDLDSADVLDRADIWQGYRTELEAALGPDYQDVLASYAEDQAAYDAYQQAFTDWSAQDEIYQAALLNPALTAEEVAALDPGPAPEPVLFEPDPVLDDLIARTPVVEEPSPDEIDLVNAVSDAEAAVLALWNKNPGDADGLGPEEEALLEQLRERFSDADLEAIAAASGS